MGFFTLVTLAAAAAPLLLLPKWMAGKRTQRIAFLRDAIGAMSTAVDRPQSDPAHRDRLIAQRQRLVAELAALAPQESASDFRMQSSVHATG
jgi:Tfp pilus assembly protein PilN